MLTTAQKATAWDKSSKDLTAAELHYVAGETRSQQLQRAEELEHLHGHPDQSATTHVFPNGWSIREPQTLGDLHREGELMSNCFRPQVHEGVAETMNPEYQPHVAPGLAEANVDDQGQPTMPFFDIDHDQSVSGYPRYKIERMDLMPWHEPIQEKGRYFSLRDPDNLPHASIDHADDYNGVLGKHNVAPKPEHQAMVDDWETKEFGEPLGGFPVTSKVKDELHVGLDVPKQAATEINQWVHDQKWPEGTEIEDIEDYHITLLFVKDGGSDHKEDDWIEHDRHAVTVKGVKEFPPSEEKNGLHPIVLLVEGETLQTHHESLASGAEGAGLDPGKYVHAEYSPHITIAYGPGLPDHVEPPTITFETAESSVSEPRDESEDRSKDRTLDDVFGDADGSYGDMWVNKDKKQVNFTFGDWEPELYDEAKELIEKEYPGWKLEGESEQGDPSEPAQYNKETGEIDHNKVPGWTTIYERGKKVSKIAAREWKCPECNGTEFEEGENDDPMHCPICEGEGKEVYMFPIPRETVYDTLNPHELPEGGLWHMAPTEDRARIQQHGLIPSNPGANPRWKGTFGVPEQQEGVYGVPRQQISEAWGDPGESDLWHIPAERIKEMRRDPLVDAFSVPHQVQPQLHTPAEEYWDWEHGEIPPEWRGTWNRKSSAPYANELVKFAREQPIVNWQKLAADIMDKGLAPKGMPRPIAEHPELGMRPVPWSQKSLDPRNNKGGWGEVNADRSKKARELSLCLLCGEPVEKGKVFVDVKARDEFADEYGHTDLLPWSRADQGSPIIDKGALHDRCAELTGAHCPSIKDLLTNGAVVAAPYNREAPGSPLSQEMKQRWEKAMQSGGTYASDSWKSRDKWPDPITDLGADPDRRTDEPCWCGDPHCAIHHDNKGDGEGSRTWRTVSSVDVTDEMWKLATLNDDGSSRAYQDSHMLAPNLPNEKPVSTEGLNGTYRGCTCKHGDKLHCPIHGLEPTVEDPGLEWSIAEGSPVGWHQLNYTKGGHEAAAWDLPVNALNWIKQQIAEGHPWSQQDLDAFMERRNQIHAEPFPQPTPWEGQPAVQQQQAS